MEKLQRSASSSNKDFQSKAFFTAVLLLCGTATNIFSQGLEEVYVEKYYVADHIDAEDSLAHGLQKGTVTYRIWVDMQEGYRLLSVFGSPGHELLISTTTSFFNDTVNGKVEAPDIDHLKLGKNPLLIDSYIAFSGASRGDLAVYKEDDKDGSVLDRYGKFLGGALVERGMLMAAHPDAGVPIRDNDGIMDGDVPALVTFGHEFEEFGNTLDASEIRVDNGAWAVLKGLPGPYKDKNYILIAQVSTTGELNLKLNLQLRSPNGDTEYYVAENPEKGQFSHPTLVYPNSQSDKSPTGP